MSIPDVSKMTLDEQRELKQRLDFLLSSTGPKVADELTPEQSDFALFVLKQSSARGTPLHVLLHKSGMPSLIRTSHTKLVEVFVQGSLECGLSMETWPKMPRTMKTLLFEQVARMARAYANFQSTGIGHGDLSARLFAIVQELKHVPGLPLSALRNLQDIRGELKDRDDPDVNINKLLTVLKNPLPMFDHCCPGLFTLGRLAWGIMGWEELSKKG